MNGRERGAVLVAEQKPGLDVAARAGFLAAVDQVEAEEGAVEEAPRDPGQGVEVRLGVASAEFDKVASIAASEPE